MSYEVFSRKAYKTIPTPWGGTRFAPNPGARKTQIANVETIEEARAICADGPANKAREAGREYRHLSFYEYTKV